MSDEPALAHAGIEIWLERRYAGRGVRYLQEVIFAIFAWTFVIFGLGVLGAMQFLEGSASEFWAVLALAQAVLTPVIAVGSVLWWRRTPAMIRWLRGERSEEVALQAWSDALAAPVRLPLTVMAIGVPFQIGASIWAADILNLGTEGIPVLMLAVGALELIGCGAPAVFAGQLAVRPMLREIRSYLGVDPPVGHARFGLAQQFYARMLVVALAAAWIGGLLVVLTDDPLVRFALVICASPVLILILAVPLFPMVTASLTGPVADLIGGSHRVAEGDLKARVPVVTNDELADLARSFNQMAADLDVMTADLRESRARIVAASDESRRRVERDLHDGAQQELVLLNLKLGQIERRLTGDPESAAMLVAARADLARALQELRDLAHGIYPAVLENDGLPGALADAARRAAIPSHVECDGAGRYRADIEAAVYFCCLEALQNASKHAGDGARATIRLAADGAALRFEVRDDGRGFDDAVVDSRVGVQNMADRIGALGGELAVDSVPGEGTTVAGSVPLA